MVTIISPGYGVDLLCFGDLASRSTSATLKPITRIATHFSSAGKVPQSGALKPVRRLGETERILLHPLNKTSVQSQLLGRPLTSCVSFPSIHLMGEYLPCLMNLILIFR